MLHAASSRQSKESLPFLNSNLSSTWNFQLLLLWKLPYLAFVKNEEETNETKEDSMPEMEASRRNDSEASLNGTKKARKVTKEALFSSREQKRAECVRKCRAVAERLTKTSAITSMNNLLEDKVSFRIFCRCTFPLNCYTTLLLS